MNIKVPKKLKCGSQVYKMKQVDDLIIEQGNVGEQRPHTGYIVIDKRLQKQRKTDVLIHEYLHAVDQNYLLNFDDNTIDRVAHGMAELLQCLGIVLEW